MGLLTFLQDHQAYYEHNGRSSSMRETMKEMFGLEGKVALVTGGNGGIGKGVARGLAGAGANIVIGARNEAKTADAAAEIKGDFSVEVIGIKVDVRQEGEIYEMVKQALDTFGGIDILVSNAGIAIHKLPQDMSIAEWDENIEINLRSFFVAAKAVYPTMKRAGGGKIISIGSLTSIFGVGALPAYGASKGGILQLTRSLAVAWAGDNIQVNCILPGWINTDLSAGGKRDIPLLEERVKARTPADRWGDPVDLAGTAVFLASPASDFVTGLAIPVDGGYAVQG
jgi:2-deoxy-D-gluconate 3-dehydrogenase